MDKRNHDAAFKLRQTTPEHPVSSSAHCHGTSSEKEGDISDAFVSLSGTARPPLPDRFRQLKCDLVRGREKEVAESWARLLRELKKENEIIAQRGPQVIPQIEFSDMENGIERLKGEIKKRGAVVVKGVIPEDVARDYKNQVEEYVAKNPHTKAFPSRDNAQVYELYWSKPQLEARAHPSLLQVQRHLISSLWHTTLRPNSRINLDIPISYADRLRIRQPGDGSFALGPHMDGGSVERWEREGYGRGGVYDAVFEGRWDEYDGWDASSRVDAVSDLYDGLGACSAFRMWQGWLSMSHTKPGEGTLQVYPHVHLSTAYVLLRPFFEPLSRIRGPGFLEEGNWVFTGEDGCDGANMTSELHGATPRHGQELNDELHPHLELYRTMVHVPKIAPGDFVAWHCDTIHAVDKVHAGQSDSSVLYIPVCPVTDTNVEYLVRQRQAFRDGTPGPDFPGGVGESQHVDRPTEAVLRGLAGVEGRRAMGLEKLVVSSSVSGGQREVVEGANVTLGL
ncbi:putative YbiU-like protein [Cladobotryum mycophilum]|uniref:YbiU-like protein n=1 Tax=Cladobotryum mycophilum TaxID=491253 RepID=A0ABR0SUK0_9HYPO